jgi:hypothetical protein
LGLKIGPHHFKVKASIINKIREFAAARGNNSIELFFVQREIYCKEIAIVIIILIIIIIIIIIIMNMKIATSSEAINSRVTHIRFQVNP